MSEIVQRIALVRQQIADACKRVNRPSESVTLIAVSKTHPASAIIEAARAGIRHFGENRIEEAHKLAAVNDACPGLTFHMIGHVQSRKARDIPAHFQWVHSVDSYRIAERYSRFCAEQNQTLNILLQVNVSGEESKEGFALNNWRNDQNIRHSFYAEVQRIAALPGIKIHGLMTIAPIVETMEQARPVFASLRQLRDALRNDVQVATWDVLSMGMTDDFPVAIEEGATHVRVGRAIFGARTIDTIE